MLGKFTQGGSYAIYTHREVIQLPIISTAFWVPTMVGYCRVFEMVIIPMPTRSWVTWASVNCSGNSSRSHFASCGEKDHKCHSNVPTTQSGLQSQYNLCQNSNGIFHRNRKYNPKICTASQKSLNNQSSLEKEEQNWSHHTFWFQTVSQVCSNQNSVLLAWKEIWSHGTE